MEKVVPFEPLRKQIKGIITQLARIFPSDGRIQALKDSEDDTVEKLLEKVKQIVATLKTVGVTTTEKSPSADLPSCPQNSKDAGVVPVCFPDNFIFDAKSFTLQRQKDGARTKLVLCNQALDHLRAIKEPVCVVCVVGPARTGKSYLLKHLQGAPFKIGHKMESETMGVWMSMHPVIHALPTGEKIRILFLDSEGIGATDNKGSSDRTDNQIFTLSVLISSILLYNSRNVPTASDLDKLDYISRLSTSIGLRKQGKSGQADADRFRKVAPEFYWLIRDVNLEMEDNQGKPCDAKTYIEQKVLAKETTPSDQSEKQNEVRDAINSFFSSIDAKAFRCPSAIPDVLKNMQDPGYKHLINPEFLQQMDEVKEALAKKYTPKKAFNEQLLTGVELADLISLYVDALNSDDGVPNWETAWDSVLELTYSRAKKTLIKEYQDKMKAIQPSMPCAEETILKKHDQVFADVFRQFKTQTQLDTERSSVQKHQKEFSELCATFDSRGRAGGVCTGGHLLFILNNNREESKIQCYGVIQRLRKSLLQPMTNKLTAATSMEAVDSVLKQIESKYHNEAKGPMMQPVLAEQLLLLQEDIETVKAVLQQMKNLDKKIKEEQRQAAAKMNSLRKQEEEARRQLEQNQALIRRQKEELDAVNASNNAEIAKLTQERRAALDSHKAKIQKDYDVVKNSLEQQLNQLISSNAAEVQKLQQEMSSVQAQLAKVSADLADLRTRRSQGLVVR